MNSRLVESIHVQLRLHLSTIVVHAFFCEEYSTRNNPLHIVSTFGLDARVRKCAMVLQDEMLLAKLSTGDLVALEAKYHAPCLASLYKKAERVKEEGEEDETSPRLPEGIALAELVSFIEESRMVSTVELPVFRLVGKYTCRLKQLGENTPARIHSKRPHSFTNSSSPRTQART